jgi:aspartate/methionine/tyrosine aminotransferase
VPCGNAAKEIDVKPTARQWIVRSSGGGYFAFVRHPFEGIRGEEVCRRLAMDAGVLILPATFFAPTAQPTIPGGESGGRAIEQDHENDSTRSLGTLVRELERWLRVSVANVDDVQIIAVATRMKAFSVSPEGL